MKVNTYLIVTRYLSSRTSDRRPYVTLSYERGGVNKPRTKHGVDNEEEEVQVKRRGPYRTKKCGCPFILKDEQMATCENWQLFVHDGRHNHAIGVYTLGHAQIKSVMHFGVETTNWAESEHSVLKILFSTCHGDLDTVFLNIDSLIEGQIADIKASLEFSRTKKNFNAKSNQILRMLVDIEAFWKTLEIDSCHPSARQHGIDSEMRSLTDLLYQISIGPISKVREMRRLAKGVLNPVLPEDPGSGSGSASRERGRPPRAPTGRGRGVAMTEAVYLLL
ncbi:hypothetical protein M9H77_25490 [Catharanthus roseus]|uniref:Uncharacterized protein n=1 Tax=Catharanthus roseus TaxID=4058 RepID=A0ACC0A714_CATRO|nr:hypothetical protein M9H77_25490 [Catharanthus roseus]